MSRNYDYSKAHPNSNHHLSKKAVALAQRMSERFGNSKFNPYEEYRGFEGAIRQLIDQGFLQETQEGLYFRNFEIIGKGR